MSQYPSPRISILSDGTSTFAGITINNAHGSLYSVRYKSYSGFDTPEGTWWMQLAKMMDGSILGNNSVLGSYVSYKGQYPIALPGRIRNLAKDGLTPEIVLVYTGMADVANDIPLDAFKRDYLEALNRVKQFYPEADVWVGTLVCGDPPAPTHMYYFPPENITRLEDFNQAIRECVQESGCHLADFAADKLTFPTVDGYHPDYKGMTIFAEAWYKYLKG